MSENQRLVRCELSWLTILKHVEYVRLYIFKIMYVYLSVAKAGEELNSKTNNSTKKDGLGSYWCLRDKRLCCGHSHQTSQTTKRRKHHNQHLVVMGLPLKALESPRARHTGLATVQWQVSEEVTTTHSWHGMFQHTLQTNCPM